VVDVVRALRGWVVAAAGGVLLLGCYLGVSAETDVGLQLPYVVSGGFGGLALVLVGSALLVADRVESAQSNHIAAAAQARIAGQVDDLHALVVAASNGSVPPGIAAPIAAGQTTGTDGAGPVGGAPVPASPPSAPPVDDGSVYAVATGRTFHRADCDLLAGKNAQRVDSAGVADRGLSPCSVCAPVPVA
jgi:hypothetical protein